MENEDDNCIAGCRDISLSPIPGGKPGRRASQRVSEDEDDRCQQGDNGNLGPSRRALQRRQHVAQEDESQKETERASAARRAHGQLAGSPASKASSSRLGMSESTSTRLERSAAAMSASASRGGSDTDDDSLEALDAQRVAASSQSPVWPEAKAVGEWAGAAMSERERQTEREREREGEIERPCGVRVRWC